MFYEPSKRNHGLTHDPFKAIVVPRPIGWISTRSKEGRVNLAPYSFFNAVAGRPPMLMFASEGYKDSLRNAVDTGEFCCNFVQKELAASMNATAAPLAPGESEFTHAGLTAAPGILIGAPRVKEAHAAMECKLLQVVELKDIAGDTGDRYMAIGQVIGVYVSDEVIRDGKLDTVRMQALSRLGYNDYAAVESVFEISRPKGGGNELTK